jgi:arylformamidase
MNFSSQAEIDAEYDAGASVPDYADYLARWRSDSEAIRQALDPELRVPYGTTAAETLDIFPSGRPGASPVHVFFHGGYWRSLSAADFHFVASGPQRLGFTTVIVDYALCPTVTIDEIVRQARASIAWVYRNVSTLNGGGAPIVVTGHSAGGHLAMMSALNDWSRQGLPPEVISAAMPISGLHDLEPLRHSYLQPELRLDEGQVERNSPIRLSRSLPLPVHFAWGENESGEFHRQSLDMKQALVTHGVAATAEAVPNANHFSVLDGFREPASELCRHLAAWVQPTDRA